MSLIRPITRRDIKGPALYGPIRDDYRHRVIALKRPRRVLIGDRVALVFENRHTLTLQIEEIIRVEGLTRDDQIQAEIDVYNEMMPNETSLSATLFVELPPDVDARAELDKLIGLDEHVVLHVGPHAIRAQFEPGRATTERIAAVQYTRYPLPAEARTALLAAGTKLVVEIDHPNYRHRVECSEEMRASLAGDYA
ncbi:MAG: DUF3501 family protein [Deltaproteobacteria bacterium]|nr:DUF3501 family protein [Deltaproteobacteria bacterium]